MRNAVCSFPDRRFDESFPVELSGKEQEEREETKHGREDPLARPARSEAGCAGLGLGLRAGGGRGKTRAGV